MSGKIPITSIERTLVYITCQVVLVVCYDSDVSETAVKRSPAPPPLDLVEAFINTADLETGGDQFATPTGARWGFLGHQLIARAEPVSERDRKQAIKLRETLRRAALANNGATVDGGTVREMNQLARNAQLVGTFAE